MRGIQSCFVTLAKQIISEEADMACKDFSSLILSPNVLDVL